MECCHIWDVNCCLVENMKMWEVGWVGICPSVKSMRAWCILFHAVVWSIWEVRNNLVFNGKKSSSDQVMDVICFRVAWWFKFFSCGSKMPISLILLNLKESCRDSKKTRNPRMVSWSPLIMDTLKFNVDGSAKGNPGLVGIGGVLWDANSHVLCLFSLSVGIIDSNSIEIMAIHQALTLCASNPVVMNHLVTIISDSKSVVS